MKVKTLFLAIALFSFTSSISAAAGDADPTFNSTGKLLTNTPSSNVPPTNLLEIQPDGKILAASSAVPPVLWRFNANGTPDITFGINGKLTLSRFQTVDGLALQSDGKILITGDPSNHQNCQLVRLTANGSIDRTFYSGRGIVITGVSSASVGRVIKVQSDGKIVVGGLSVTTAPPDVTTALVVLRYNPNGSLDKTFSDDGIAVTAYGLRGYQEPKALLIQPDGKMILFAVTGYGSFSDRDFTAIRLNSDGSFDNGFGIQGVTQIADPSMEERPSDAVLLPDGKIILAGARGSFAVMVRLNANGSQDMTFGSGGFAVLAGGITLYSGALVLRPDGKILVGGEKLVSGVSAFAVGLYDSDGVLDSSFNVSPEPEQNGFQPLWGTNGIATTSFDQADSVIYSMAVDAAARVVVSGWSHPLIGGSGYLALARYQSGSAPFAGISGTVRTASGLPIKNTTVVVSGGGLAQPVLTFTNQLGIYFFTDLPVTETYSVSVSSKRFSFAADQQNITLNQNTENVDFTAEP